MEELIKNKSVLHLELEKALKKNRETISQLASNSSIVNELRKQTRNIIKQLTSEIQREYKEEHKSRKLFRYSAYLFPFFQLYVFRKSNKLIIDIIIIFDCFYY